MGEYVSLTIDGSEVRAPRGASVLEAALDYGICIPHLCHLKGLLPAGVCRLCLVELVQEGRARVVASCTLEAAEGLVVRAHTERILRLRRGVAEMLVAEAPNSRAIQDIAVRCGVKSVRYPFRHESCIRCGRCARSCAELRQSRWPGFAGRGLERRVALPFDRRPGTCQQCDACIAACPMTIAPCDGPMRPGEEYLCGKCESQLLAAEESPQSCVWCRLGEGFACARRAAAR